MEQTDYVAQVEHLVHTIQPRIGENFTELFAEMLYNGEHPVALQALADLAIQRRFPLSGQQIQAFATLAHHPPRDEYLLSKIDEFTTAATP
ncbi:hypothetical protein [Natronoglycomyces albus]|uniref:Uncharacterized protein n=1 Tax=Natronoglycomyces albus TaxID=2811108 RepID=A0A895XMM6_9ACTN|nr:hypothetical protein [Natronoglycomyces albus]QSB04649.1 hypothetical protein JQS30_12825 [Natronoglycomyces albus]